MATGIEAMVKLRRMTVDDLAAAHELSSEQKWPHRIEDWDMLLSLGFGYVATRDGDVIGTAMAWLYGTQAATLGMVIVSPAAQGMGIGRQLMEAVLDDLDGRTVLLNASRRSIASWASSRPVRCSSIRVRLFPSRWHS